MTITTEPHNNGYALFATGLGGTAIAGPRLFRAPPWPDIRWVCDTREGAEREARKLQDYLDALPARKKGKKKSSAMSAYQD